MMNEQQLLEKFNPLVFEHTFVSGNTIDSYIKKHEVNITSRGTFDFFFTAIDKNGKPIVIWLSDFRFRLYSPTLIDQYSLNSKTVKFSESKIYTLEVNKNKSTPTYKIEAKRQDLVGKILNQFVEGDYVHFIFQPENTTEQYEIVKENSPYQISLINQFVALFPPRPQNNMPYWGFRPLNNYPLY